MEELSNWTEVVMTSIETIGMKVISTLPNIIGAVLLIVIGWLIAKLVANVILRIFKTGKFINWEQNLNESEALDQNDIKIDLGKVISKFVYWVIILIFLITASDTLGWNTVSKGVGDLVRYLPKLFSAILILVIGIYIASLIKKAIQTAFLSMGVSGAKVISSLVFYIVIVVVSVTALNQAGIETAIITSNITLILGSVLFAFALAFGLGSRDILQNMLSSLYSKRSFQVGEKIKVGTDEGTIESIDSINIVLRTSNGKVVLPAQDLLNQRVEILD